MLGAVFKDVGSLVLEERPKPAIQKETEVLIKVTHTGICGTDLHILQDPPAHPAKRGIILGHEFTGIIEGMGSDVEGFSIGDSVLIDPHPGCGVCAECRRGYPDHCIPLYGSSGEEGHPNTVGIFSDGAFAAYTIVPRQSVYPVDSSVPSHIAALAEPLACVCNAAEKVGAQPGEYAVILGAGPVGLLFTMLLRANGVSKIMVSEPSPYRRKAAEEAGADIVVDPLEADLTRLVHAEMGAGADVVIEAVGSLLPECVGLIRPGGKIIQFGHDETVNPAIPVGELLKKEGIIYGAFIGKYRFGTAARIMESGRLPLDLVVSHTLPLHEIGKGLELLKKGEGLKIMIAPE